MTSAQPRRSSISRAIAALHDTVGKSNLSRRTRIRKVSTEGLPPGWDITVDPLARPNPDIDADEIRAFLSSRKFPVGLIEAVVNSARCSGKRYYVVDDSTSMSTEDGRRLIFSESHTGDAFHVGCSRWRELEDELRFQAGLVHASNMQADFKLLNGHRYHLPKEGAEGYANLMASFDDPPSGTTPLCRVLSEIIDEIENDAPALLEAHRKAYIIIFTDGLASDGELLNVLNRVSMLPVWVVVRLSTNEDAVVDYWRGLDRRMVLDMDVLSSPYHESIDVHEVNAWLSYNYFLHRAREFGITLKEIDELHDTPLSTNQLRTFTSIILGVPRDLVPAPELHEGHDFCQFVEERQQHMPEPVVHNLFYRSARAWFNVEILKKKLKKKKKSVCAVL